MTAPVHDPAGQVPAPGLREVAATRWDVDRDPVVAWSDDRTTFWLLDPERPTDRVELFRGDAPPRDPHAVATALAETVASCDFPPTEDHASRPRVLAALRAAGMGDVAERADGGGA